MMELWGVFLRKSKVSVLCSCCQAASLNVCSLKHKHILLLISHSALFSFDGYAITNTKSLEQYEMNIPLYTPTPDFALDLGLFNDRSATYEPYCRSNMFDDSHHPGADPSSPYEFSPNARSIHGDNRTDELFWIKFSEIYLWPCVEYFSSWEELLSKLERINEEGLMATSRCMAKANSWKKFERESTLCWVLQQLEEEAPRRNTVQTYRESIHELYNVTHLF